MMAIWVEAVMVSILFFATIFRSAFGFGEALVAVPLRALVVPVEVAAPVAVLVSIAVALVVVLQDWRHVQARSAGWLFLFTLAGIPLGLLMLKEVPESAVKAVLAALIAAFSIFSLLGGGKHELTNDRWAWLFGFGAGLLGGAYGMNGPPLVIFGSLRKWSPAHFRATLQGYFLPASLIGMFGYWLTGLWTPLVTRFPAISPRHIAGNLAGTPDQRTSENAAVSSLRAPGTARYCGYLAIATYGCQVRTGTPKLGVKPISLLIRPSSGDGKLDVCPVRLQQRRRAQRLLRARPQLSAPEELP